jgi:hypothetical protein
MSPQELPNLLAALWGDAVQTLSPGCYQVETEQLRLLVLLSEDQSWLRVLVPIAPADNVLPFALELLEANFDQTQESRYALAQDVLWGVFQHSLADLSQDALHLAIQHLINLYQVGTDEVFRCFVEKRVREIIQAAKQQGQSLEMTLQTLDRFYEEGVMGDGSASPQEREQVLATWRYQLERLWDEVDS